MGRLLDLAKAAAGEKSLSGAFGRWILSVSGAADMIPGMEAEITQLQVNVTAPGSAFITQTAWYINASTGNDTNDASIDAPIKTLSELTRRFLGVFDPTATAVNVYLSGVFTEPLSLRARFSKTQAVLTIQGEMSALHSGSGTYTAFVPASDVRAVVAEGVVNLAGYVGKRVRITNGASSGGVTYVASSSGLTALVGQFEKIIDDPTGPYNDVVTPANGSNYVIEDHITVLKDCDVRCDVGFVILRDLKFNNDWASVRSALVGSRGAYTAFFFGCSFTSSVSAVYNISGAAALVCCYNSASMSFLAFNGVVSGAVARGAHYYDDGSYIIGYHNIHQESSVFCGTGTVVEDLGHRGMFGVGGAAAFEIATQGRYFQLNANAPLWGSGNTAIATTKVGGPCSFAYVTKPTISGTGTDAVIGGVPKTWAEIPYIDIGAGTNNSGAMLVQQQ